MIMKDSRRLLFLPAIFAMACTHAQTSVATPDAAPAVEPVAVQPVSPAVQEPAFNYPAAAKVDRVDTYHGVAVVDSYRWLEDIDSPQTRAWIDAEVDLTNRVVGNLPHREAIRAQLEKVWNFERWSVPFEKAGRYFVSRNSGLQNQPVVYWAEKTGAPLNVLIDPNQLSEDGTAALSGLAVSDDGRYLAYGVSLSGSDWQTWRVREVDTGKELSDEIKWVKFSGASWTPDGKGFYYSRYDAPPPGKELSQINYYQKLFYHELGTPQEKDVLIYERQDQKEWGFRGSVTEDGKYLLIDVSRGTDPRNLVFYQDLRRGKGKTVELVSDFEASYDFIANEGPIAYFRTDLDAPKRRVIAIDLRRPDRKNWREIIAQNDDTLTGVSYLDGRFVAEYLKDAHSTVAIYSKAGKKERDLELPGLGTTSGFGGKKKADHTYFSFRSFSDPGRVYRYDLKKNSVEVHLAPELPFNPDDFVTRQVFYPSKDGTSIPMFISHRKDLKIDGNNPTHLYAYGGFGISLTPSFSSADLVWMQMGGIYAQPNLRGGGEYGETWHEAGTKIHKQNVFDDFIAAGEYLVANGITKPKHLVIGGRSNGGLLVGATLVQRPDLFAAALPGVGVLDMIRFKEFTIGRAWVSDYGTPDDPAEFKALLAYSPLHNVVKGTQYPATMIYTADHDDRVYPAHSFKFAAALQSAQSGSNPALIRIATKAGHGAGMPTSKLIDQWADLWTFAAHYTGLVPNFPKDAVSLSAAPTVAGEPAQ
jgi:prolyl oligopeptidase